MESIFPKLFEMLPDADHFLSLEPEELAGPLLVSLDGNQYIKLSTVISAHLMSLSFDIMPSEKIQRYPSKDRDEILLRLMEAWQWLEREGFVAPRPSNPIGTEYFVTKRGQSIETPEVLETYHKANLLPKRQLHPIIAQKVWSIFLRGDYDIAVFQAFKQVEVAVRKAGNYDETDLGTIVKPTIK